jgi:transcriptional regulator with PAS, ATPase and Fis domain
VVTPSLAEQLADSPGVLRDLVLHMSRRVVGEEAAELAREVLDWIENKLGIQYDWPGNYRELEQCVKNVLIRRNYRPSVRTMEGPVETLLAEIRGGGLTAEEVLSQYVTMVYHRTGSYEETARRLGLDRRTVKAKVNAEFLGKLG